MTAFPIPMRGNESAVSASLMFIPVPFPIPMRGNELAAKPR